MQKARKIPQRTCIACREMQDKKNLLRIVRTPTGEIRPDPTGKAAGRGAYICKKAECVGKMIKFRLLNKTFSADVPAEAYKAVEEVALGE